jgi:hypothetical protein
MATATELAHDRAGHAVALCNLDIDFEYVTIESDAFPHVATDTGDEVYTEGEIVARYAGPIAQRKYCPRGCWYKDNAVDFATAEEMLDEVADADAQCRRLHKRLLWRRAEVLVYLHWADIQAVAQALLDRQRLSHSEVTQAINRANAVQVWSYDATI